jgi:DNA-binding LacI/PurR family transcriptional regulator
MNNAQYKKDSTYTLLKESILSGKYQPNMKLPSELKFAKELGVGKVTLRSALAKLEKDGLIIKLPSRGTFVKERPKKQQISSCILIIFSFLDSFESPSNYILPDLQNSAKDRGYKTETAELSFIESLTPDELKQIIKQNNITGIVVMAANYNGSEPLIAQLKSTNLPVVIPHAKPHDTRVTGFASIVIDQRAAWREAIDHLCSQGHERIATIAIEPHKIRGYHEDEYLELLKQCGAESSKELIGYTPYDKTSIKAVVEKWLNSPKAPTAILCFSDFFALHIYDILKQNNLRIPDDIAVMGYCGYPGSNFLSPPLSTIDFEYAKFGSMSIDLLAKSKSWHSMTELIAPPPRVIKPYKLIIRESTSIKRVDKILAEELING